MAKQRYTDEQKSEAIRIAQESTAVEAERITGIKATTIRSWLSRGSIPVATKRSKWS
ncbi:hypothetical protein [Tumebacillus lipolyticus]|uniref:Transposase n=1 Tax=Tumebacillus lipolyticus TaxID=1280370 RepID=A0ABW5A2B9_9BACL